MGEIIAVATYFVSLFIFIRILLAVSKWKALIALYMPSSVPSAFANSRTIYYWAIGFFCALAISSALFVYEDISLTIFGIVCVYLGYGWATDKGEKTAFNEYRSIAASLAIEASAIEDKEKYEIIAQTPDSELLDRIKLYRDQAKQV